MLRMGWLRGTKKMRTPWSVLDAATADSVNCLASVSSGRTVRLWDADRWQCQTEPAIIGESRVSLTGLAGASEAAGTRVAVGLGPDHRRRHPGNYRVFFGGIRIWLEWIAWLVWSRDQGNAQGTSVDNGQRPDWLPLWAAG
jgi:hypothetical protein